MADDEKTVVVAPPDTVAEGTQLSGTYELDARIASGGMGEVYRGHNIQTGDPVAIKIVLPEFARDSTILALFRKEASILNHLSHEAIVRYHVFAIDQGIGRPYLAMEFVDGLSLVEIVKRGPMPPGDARKLLLRLASGLAAAHEAGIIHRDLSPDNVILPGGRVDRAKIIDFGIARSANVGGETLLGGAFAGKYNFVSPEQLGMAGGEVTEKSDIYSLGLIMGAVLRGAVFNMTGSQVQVIEKRRVVPDLSGIEADILPVVAAMLQPEPSDRPSSMQEIADWVREVDRRQRETTEGPKAVQFDRFDRPAVTQQPVRPAEGAMSEPVEAATTPPASQTTSGAGAPRNAPSPSVVSESPFGPYTGPDELTLPGTSAEGTLLPPRSGRRRGSGGLGASLAAAGLVVVLGGAYLGGAFDAFLAPPRSEVAPPVESEPPATPATPAAPAETPPPATPQTPVAPQAAEPDRPPDVQPPSSVEPAAQTKPPAETVAPPETPAVPAEPREQPPVAPQEEGPSAVDEAARRLDWLRSFAGGDCFFATALSATGEKTEIEGFGREIDGFQRLLAEFTAAFKVEPDIAVRLIRDKQCPVTTFLHALRDGTGKNPELTLAKYELADRDPMSGEVQILPDRQTYLLLVDHDGIAHNLDSILKRSGETATFSIALGLGAAKDGSTVPVPEVLLAIATSAPVDALRETASVPAAALLPRIAAELEAKKIDAVATPRYLRIRQ